MFAPVKGNYSEEFKSLVMDMLQRDPDSRPSAADLCQLRLPSVSVALVYVLQLISVSCQSVSAYSCLTTQTVVQKLIPNMSVTNHTDT